MNGDDFGISEEVNEAVTECFDRRILTSTTLMVNMPYADQAVELSRKYGFAEMVGLHLNLTSGEPLTEEIRHFRRFCRKNGTFNAKFEKNTWTRLSISRQESAAVSREIEAQIKKYFDYGLPERHLDSHHHVHTDRSVMKVLLPLLKKYRFRSVRLTRNLFREMSFPKRIYKKNFNEKLKKNGFFTTDYFGSIRDLAVMDTDIPDNALLEVMVHPMYGEDGVLMDTSVPMEDVTALLNSLRAERQAWEIAADPKRFMV